MKNSVKQDLENITVDNLMEFKTDCFSVMTSSKSSRGMVNLGCSANGQFLVKRKNETWRFNNPSQAIDKYKELVSD